LWVPLIVIITVVILSMIKTTQEMFFNEKYLTKEELSALQFIRETAQNKNLTIEEYIETLK